MPTAPARRSPTPSPRPCPTCATAPGRASSSNSSRTARRRRRRRLMLARIAHELYWLGTQPRPRRVHRPRRGGGLPLRAAGHLRGRARRQLRLGRPAGDARRRRRGRRHGGPGARPAHARPRSDPDRCWPSIERAREGARTVRDVISAEMWEAINTTSLGAARRRAAGLGGAGQHLAAPRSTSRSAPR